MFVVYSPEGQAYLGLQNTLPPLKPETAQPVPPVEKPTLQHEQVELDRRYQQVPLTIEQARRQYEQVRRAAQARGETLVEVREIMSSPVVSITQEATLEEAWRLFEQHAVGTLPVMGENHVVGLLSVTDLMGLVWRRGHGMQVREGQVAEVMSSPVVTCWPDTLIRRAARVMTDYRIHSLPVVDGQGKLEGMVTASDLVRRLALEPPLELYV